MGKKCSVLEIMDINEVLEKYVENIEFENMKKIEQHMKRYFKEYLTMENMNIIDSTLLEKLLLKAVREEQ
ncbi:hypothetical protein [Haliovirga abyssi]|uniref:Uncharacterized protein n=1 Tax=Haliovirga abyssi TaxID=2996794 RepID=A0AAU9DP26_9FUSO|nr:hypothetical protein [Haliovirga abyssi]BDU50143.1 hypothetical protein HLVA_07120 [Haliovirga abyssi]